MKNEHTKDRKPVAGKTNKTGLKFQAWIQARKRHHLSHAQVQMARKPGLNPDKLGKLDNHAQEPWKSPLPLFIEGLYFKRFGKKSPDQVLSIEKTALVPNFRRHDHPYRACFSAYAPPLLRVPIGSQVPPAKPEA